MHKIASCGENLLRRRFFLKWHSVFAGAAAGAVNGLFGAGGGMVLVPLLRNNEMTQEEIFASSIVIIFPMCILSLLPRIPLPWHQAMPFVISGSIGGILAATFGKRIPVIWLHRVLGVLILYGGMRYLW
jgi:uncharacterized membrane protein YfcA